MTPEAVTNHLLGLLLRDMRLLGPGDKTGRLALNQAIGRVLEREGGAADLFAAAVIDEVDEDMGRAG